MTLILMQIILVAVCTDPCINGGTCIEPDVCQCPEPYGGVTCADSKSLNGYNFIHINFLFISYM